MKTESPIKEKRFRNYYIGCQPGGLPFEVDGCGYRRLLVYDAFQRGLRWLDVVGESRRTMPRLLGELRAMAARCERVGHRSLVPVREIGEDDGLLYVIRDVASGEDIAEYVKRLGSRLPLWDSLDLALVLAEIHAAVSGDAELAGAIAVREALVDIDDGDRLVLRFESLPSSSLRGDGKARGTAGIPGFSAALAVCDFLHFCLTGQWIAVGSSGQPRPSLGELPEETRCLVWAVCQGRAGEDPEALDGLVRALEDLKARVPRQGAGSDRIPRCRIGRLLFDGCDLEATFGRKFAREAPWKGFHPVGRGADTEPVVQQPFGYAMTLRALPAASVFADPAYTRHLEAVGDEGRGGDRGALRVCARATRGGVDYLVEETVNGASLEAIASRRGGFDPTEALDLLGRIDETLVGLEARGRMPWRLCPANCLLHFTSRMPRGGEGILNENVACWPEYAMVLRLHPTMADLVAGRTHAAGEAGGGAGEFAALFWHLLAFGRRQGPVGADGSYRPIRRLRGEGNAFLRDALSPSVESAGASGRAAFLKRARALAAEGAFDGPVDARDSGCRAGGATFPGFTGRALLRAPRASRVRTKARPTIARLTRRAAAIAAIAGGLGAGALLFHPGGRHAAVARFDRLFGASTALPERASASRDAIPARVAASNLAPVVLTSARSKPLEERAGAKELSGCVPPPDADLPAAPGLDGGVELVENLLRSLRAAGPVAWDATGLAALRRAAAAGAPTALLCLGDAFDRAGDPLAIDWYRDSAVSGHPAGMRVYAECLLNGTGVAADPSEALLWFRKASAAGDSDASDWLSDFEQAGAGDDAASRGLAGGQ